MSYGDHKNNSSWFYSYGFLPGPNDHNGVVITLHLDEDAIGFEWKRSEIEYDAHSFHVNMDLMSENSLKFLSNCRYDVLKKKDISQVRAAKTRLKRHLIEM